MNNTIPKAGVHSTTGNLVLRADTTLQTSSGDIDIEGNDNASIEATVVTPVVQVGVSFTSTSPSISIGVSSSTETTSGEICP